MFINTEHDFGKYGVKSVITDLTPAAGYMAGAQDSGDWAMVPPLESPDLVGETADSELLCRPRSTRVGRKPIRRAWGQGSPSSWGWGTWGVGGWRWEKTTEVSAEHRQAELAGDDGGKGVQGGRQQGTQEHRLWRGGGGGRSRVRMVGGGRSWRVQVLGSGIGRQSLRPLEGFYVGVWTPGLSKNTLTSEWRQNREEYRCCCREMERWWEAFNGPGARLDLGDLEGWPQTWWPIGFGGGWFP